jgi:4-hydroxy-2-oxoheptanedioate aldolase
MSEPSLAGRLRSGDTLYSAWSAIPEPLVSEFLARSAFDVVTLDMQHGCHSVDSVVRGLGAIKLGGKPGVVRIPLGRFDMASRALDLGADAVIAPMVNSLADARAFAAAMKFPPVGERSWGPTRTLALHGVSSAQAYLEAANRETLAIAMIETHAAQEALDDILAVEGIDGILVGPSDLSIALSNGARIDPTNEEMLDAAGAIAERAREAGKIPCAYAGSAAAAKRARAMGFRFIALGSDFGYLTAGATTLVNEARA